MRDKILEVLEGLNDNEIKKLWNEVAGEAGYEEIFDLVPSEFDEVLGGKSPWDLLQEIDEDFNSNDDYFYFNESYGTYVSTSDIYDLVDVELLANLVSDIYDDGNLSDYYNIPLEIIDLCEEEEEDEE